METKGEPKNSFQLSCKYLNDNGYQINQLSSRALAKSKDVAISTTIPSGKRITEPIQVDGSKLILKLVNSKLPRSNHIYTNFILGI